MLTRLVALLSITILLVALAAACGTGEAPVSVETTSGIAAPTPTFEVTYDVRYADSRPGTATVSYLDESGQTVETDVDTPWEMDGLPFDVGTEVFVEAVAEPVVGAAVQCEVVSDASGGVEQSAGTSGSDGCSATLVLSEDAERPEDA